MVHEFIAKFVMKTKVTGVKTGELTSIFYMPDFTNINWGELNLYTDVNDQFQQK